MVFEVPPQYGIHILPDRASSISGRHAMYDCSDGDGRISASELEAGMMLLNERLPTDERFDDAKVIESKIPTTIISVHRQHSAASSSLAS